MRRQTEVRFACCRNMSNGPDVFSGYSRRGERRYASVWIESAVESRPCEYSVTVCTRALACSFDDRVDWLESGLNDAFRRDDDGDRRSRLSTMSPEQRTAYRDAAKRIFSDAYDAYMARAFPAGELRPVSCQGGDFELVKLPAVTLIDALDTLAVVENTSEFRRAVSLVTSLFGEAGFDLDVNVSVFETNIRVLGGLLSAHGLAANSELGLYPGYNGSLLVLAEDLGRRLLPAFETATGIPYGTVNLRHGVPRGETAAASVAGGGSLSLEMSVLSAYTGNPIFGDKGRDAARALYERRAKTTGLLGKHVNVQSGKWIESLSGIGSNSDSFYEYLAKNYALLGDLDSWTMFADAYEAVDRHSRIGAWYADVDMFTAKPRRQHFENLQAFWPGVQAAAGDLSSAADSLNAFYLVFQDWAALPENFDFRAMQLFPSAKTSLRSPLRPELLESTLILHRATHEPSWLWAAARVLEAIDSVNKAPCGFASLANAATQTLDDEMPSFFLAETAKYLYLIFAPDNLVDRGDYVFSTEAHLFSISAVRAPTPPVPLDHSDSKNVAHGQHAPRQRTRNTPASPRPSLKRWLETLWRRIEPKKQLFRRRETVVSGESEAEPETASTYPDHLVDVNTYSADAEARRCARPEWWEVAAYDPDFDDVRARRSDWPRGAKRDASGERAFFSPPLGRYRCFEADHAAFTAAAAVSDDEDDDEKHQEASNQVAHTIAHQMGVFRVEVYDDSFHVSNDEDGEEIRVSNIGSSLTLATSIVGDDAVALAVDADGLEIDCQVEARIADNRLEVPCTIAAFGSAVGHDVHLYDKALFLPDQLIDDHGCDPTPAAHPDTILVVRRGECLFEEKARLAERASAAAILVVNSVPGTHRFVMANASGEPGAEDGKPAVTIPAVMIAFDDAAELQKLASLTSSSGESLRATLHVARRRIPPDSPMQLIVADRSLYIIGRGDWGIFFKATSDAPSDGSQLYIVPADAQFRKALAARVAGTLCDMPSIATLDAHVTTPDSSAPVEASLDFFRDARQATHCACPYSPALHDYDVH